MQRTRRSPVKPPDRCPHCNSPRIAAKGSRAKKLETVALYRCRGCDRIFTAGPRSLRNKTYPVQLILEAMTAYNRGYSLEEVSRRISARHGHVINASTISRWLSAHPDLTTYRRLRARGLHYFKPPQIIHTIKLYHRQVYEFAYHRAKLEFLREDRSPSARQNATNFASLADFLEQVPALCPHELFRDEGGARGSQLAATFLNTEQLKVFARTNAATATAGLVIPSVGTNYDRHPKLQSFMLANDSATVAVEVPIWLDETDIVALEKHYRISIVPKDLIDPARPARGHKPRHITGHIDFLQVRSRIVHILDYKPDARTNKPIAQLTIYALALTRLVPGLRLFDVKCAWFNENCYNEFFPRLLLPQRDLLSSAREFTDY